MSKEFIKAGYNRNDVLEASQQQEQLSYFTESSLQSSIVTDEYIKAWAERKYQSNDYFLNYVKSVFKTDNFLLFFKFLRKPLPSTKIIKNKIEPNLHKVFYAEDASFDYDVVGADYDDIMELLNPKWFNDDLFYHILYRFNDVIICDVNKEGEPYRYFLDVSKIVSIKTHGDKIKKIAFSGEAWVDGEKKTGYVYIDDDKYQFYSDDYTLLLDVEHDIDSCPATFVTNKRYKQNNIVREGIFTFVREELEEYVFLKTLQKMTEPNGAIPVITKLEAQEEGYSDIHGSNNEPPIDGMMGSQVAQQYSEVPPTNGGIMQAGSVYDVPVIERADGSIDMDAVKNYINFHYMPIESLNYVNDRIKEIETSLLITLVGDEIGGNESAKNEMQIEKSISSLQNTLNVITENLNYARYNSDKHMLSLKYGSDRVQKVFVHYGTDHFIDSIDKLMKDFKEAPNQIERKELLVRISQNRYKNNPQKQSRQKLLYELMPYCSDADFDKAVSLQIVSDIDKELQTRFNYWVNEFENKYGSLVTFYKEANGGKSDKIKLIRDLIILMINEEQSVSLDFTTNNQNQDE